MRPSIATFPKTTIIIHNIDRVVRNSDAISDWLSSKHCAQTLCGYDIAGSFATSPRRNLTIIWHLDKNDWSTETIFSRVCARRS